MNDLKQSLHVVYMGGTLGCIGQPLVPLPAEAFFAKLTAQWSNVSLHCYAAPVIADSSALRHRDWLELVLFLQQLRTQGIDRVLLIHGTDTLSYAAAVLSRFLAQSMRVVITGSQVPLWDATGQRLHPHSDAWGNLQFAWQQLQHCAAGCYVAFAEQLIPARSSLKIQRQAWQGFADLSLTRPNAIHSDDYSNADAANHRVNYITSAPNSATPMTLTANHLQQIDQINIINVQLQPINSQVLCAQLQQLQAAQPDFLLLQAYGSGNFALTPALCLCLQQLAQQGCLCILTSQVPFGCLSNDYAVNAEHHAAGLLADHSASPADLYAKMLQVYLQYPTAALRRQHWLDSDRF